MSCLHTLTLFLLYIYSWFTYRKISSPCFKYMSWKHRSSKPFALLAMILKKWWSTMGSILNTKIQWLSIVDSVSTSLQSQASSRENFTFENDCCIQTRLFLAGYLKPSECICHCCQLTLHMHTAHGVFRLIWESIQWNNLSIHWLYDARKLEFDIPIARYLRHSNCSPKSEDVECTFQLNLH